jgi:electron transport complex protein RnfG
VAKKGFGMDKLKHFIEQSWLLIVASFAFGLLLAATNYALEPTIIRNKIAKLNRKAGVLLPAAKEFVPLELADANAIRIKSARGKEVEIAAYKGVSADGNEVGWAFNVSGSGFADRIELVVVVDYAFEKMMGYGVLSSNETPGFGDKINDPELFLNQFKGVPVGKFKLLMIGDRSKIDSEIIAISGATISSEAVVAILNDSLGQIKEQMQKKGLIGDGK